MTNDQNTPNQIALNNIKRQLWTLCAYKTCYTTSEMPELIDPNNLDGVDKLAQGIVDSESIDPAYKISLRELRDAAIALNRYVVNLEEVLHETQTVPEDIERGALMLNTASVHRERGVFEPESVRYDKSLKSYIISGRSKTSEGETNELLFCSHYSYFYELSIIKIKKELN